MLVPTRTLKMREVWLKTDENFRNAGSLTHIRNSKPTRTLKTMNIVEHWSVYRLAARLPAFSKLFEWAGAPFVPNEHVRLREPVRSGAPERACAASTFAVWCALESVGGRSAIRSSGSLSARPPTKSIACDEMGGWGGPRAIHLTPAEALAGPATQTPAHAHTSANISAFCYTQSADNVCRRCTVQYTTATQWAVSESESDSTLLDLHSRPTVGAVCVLLRGYVRSQLPGLCYRTLSTSCIDLLTSFVPAGVRPSFSQSRRPFTRCSSCDCCAFCQCLLSQHSCSFSQVVQITHWICYTLRLHTVSFYWISILNFDYGAFPELRVKVTIKRKSNHSLIIINTRRMVLI